MTRFSGRTGWPTESNALSLCHQEKIKNGEDIIDLSESNPTRCGFDFLTPPLLKGLENPASLLYEPDPHGLLKARLAVCDYYRQKRIALTPEQVFLTSSTSEAYAFILRLLCDAQDAVLVPRPSYPLFDYLAALNDVDLFRYPLEYGAEGWRLERATFVSPSDGRPKALVVVNPNNPTGNFVCADERALLNAFCRHSGAALISDEVFLDYGWNGEGDAHSLAGNTETLTFTLSGVSKILGLPQMKLSWMVVGGPDALRAQAIQRLEVIADTYLSVNTPSQQALSAWLEMRGAAQGEIRRRLAANLQILRGGTDKNSRLLKAQGGWYAVLRVESGHGDEELALEALRKQNVLTHPGYFFDFDEGNYLVLSLLPPTARFKEGVARLYQALAVCV